MNAPGRSTFSRWSLFAIFLVSVVVIALQLALLRALSVIYYYHFTYLVISTALLGFGASGTLLALLYDRWKRNFPFWNQLFLLLFLVSIPSSWLAAVSIPLDTHYLFYSRGQILLLLLHNAILFLPFLFGGLVIGFMLTWYSSRVPVLYGSNLIGSAAGGLLALLLMTLVPPQQLPLLMAPFVLLAMFAFLRSCSPIGKAGRGVWLLLIAGVVASAGSLLVEPDEKVDSYKALAHFRQMELQGDAEQVARRFGPRAQIDVFASPAFHYTLFAGPQATVMPPPQLAILLDGAIAAPLFAIDSSDEAAILDFTPQSLPYRLLDEPHVLLLGEVSGVNVWMARRMGASRITVVQTDPRLSKLLTEELRRQGGEVLLSEDVELVVGDPRLYLERSRGRYDLIRFVAGEATATGSGGLQGLNEDYLLTRESVATALSRLTPAGVLSITRGIQSPLRDNIKIVSMFIEGARLAGIEEPFEHLLVSRNYLAANHLLARSPIVERRRLQFLEAAGELQLDVEYLPGIRSESIEQINRIEGPEGRNYSYLHHAIHSLLFEDPDRFYDEWVYQVRSPTDDSPYFHDYFKWSSLDRFLESYGDEWFQRLELGYVLLLVTFVQLLVAAFLFILLPLLLRRESYRRTRNKLPTLLHFSMIGTGFMFLEITFIQAFVKYLGDPIFSAAAVICSILLFSGAGSVLQGRIGLPAIERIRLSVAAILLIMLLYLLVSASILNLSVALPAFWRFLFAILMIAPVSFFLGWMFPAGVELLERRDPSLIPWAWGVNGFASVSAAPLAIILSISIGFNGVILLGMACYLLAGLASRRWS